MKKLIKIFLVIALLSISIINVNADPEKNYTKLDVGEINTTGTDVSGKDNLKHSVQKGSDVNKNNDLFQGIKDGESKFLNANTTGERGMSNFIMNIAKDIKNIFLAITGIYFLIIVLRQLMSENAEEEFEKFKKGIRWITAGIILMQISYSFVDTIYNKEVDGKLAGALTHNIIQPMVSLLEYAASFFFIAIAIFAYYRIVSSNGDEEKAKKGKMSVAYAIVGFVVIQISKYLVGGVYSQTLCDASRSENNKISCNASEIQETAGVMFDIINWTNGFVGIVVVIMIIYSGVQIIFSNGEEEKIKKAKKSLLYIVIGIVILSINFIILTFFSTKNVLSYISNNLLI